jgi:DNA-directed RNA polymerase subunit RPC12/RpoP
MYECVVCKNHFEQPENKVAKFNFWWFVAFCFSMGLAFIAFLVVRSSTKKEICPHCGSLNFVLMSSRPKKVKKNQDEKNNNVESEIEHPYVYNNINEQKKISFSDFKRFSLALKIFVVFNCFLWSIVFLEMIINSK